MTRDSKVTAVRGMILFATCALSACSDPDGIAGDAEDLEASLAVHATGLAIAKPGASSARVRGFEEVHDWHAEGATLNAISESSAGEQALAIRLGGASIITSEHFRVKTPITRVALDLRVSEMQADGAGTLEIALNCPSVGLSWTTVHGVNLAAVATGRYEIESKRLEPAVARALRHGCRDLRIRFSIASSVADVELALDRLELDYRVAVDRQALCWEPDHEALLDPSEMADGFSRYHLWRSGASVQKELARLQDVVSLEPAALGLVGDNADRTFKVFVDADSALKLEQLAERVSEVEPTLPLVVQHSCRGRVDLDRELTAIRNIAAPVVGRGHPVFHGLDVGFGRYDVLLPPSESDVGTALATQLGSSVHVRYGAIGSHSRLEDGQPHYGGAALWVAGAGAGCTAGFVVNRGSERGAITAGHCFTALDEGAYTAQNYTYWGAAKKFPADRTAWDAAYVTDVGQTYSPWIHTDPGTPTTRRITAKANPSPNQIVCISGKTYGAKCSVVIRQMESTFPILLNGVYYTRRNVWFGERLGTNIAAEGDSGAPIYIPLTSTTGQAIGMHIAGMMNAPFDQTWFHSVADVESQLGVTIAF